MTPADSLTDDTDDDGLTVIGRHFAAALIVLTLAVVGLGLVRDPVGTLTVAGGITLFLFATLVVAKVSAMTPDTREEPT